MRAARAYHVPLGVVDCGRGGEVERKGRNVRLREGREGGRIWEEGEVRASKGEEGRQRE